ncbi:beta-ketoacyl-[acyl-carrier-protein] synthase family protein [Spiractinospora alimapuensis]|uniref:beta-ketoacyl-[acyl-carrier-protein] synthase family protein n=1 Tax=Spiractinospora alimapuensis TaxID=2820884 RepID=UPI001F44E390|nr:beta-ketoacyl-[acyl-carrier-protein] synthase family protein [Spiractinospora alimapuensis]QVQ51830.1 beta-ketoacyl-[acyl-carrier-protein] synthase family protein [Spiractinospora alimapuensis]
MATVPSDILRPERVVITGRGVVSPVGPNWEQTWRGLVAGRSGIGPITEFEADDLPVRIGGELTGFDATDHLSRTLLRRVDWPLRPLLAAAQMARDEAGLALDTATAPRAGVLAGSIIGSTRLAIASQNALDQEGYGGVGPFVFPTMGVSVAGEMSLLLGARGPCMELVAACATGTACVGEGMRLIQSGAADVVFAGGVDAFTRLEIAAAARARTLSRDNDDPARASRPFDTGRDGFVMAAGAGVLVLESLSHARRRDAEILAEVAGYAATSDAHQLTAPPPEAPEVERAVRRALASADVEPADVDYVNAHGTATPTNDTNELTVLRRVLPDHATTTPVSSTKSMTGHMLAASGAVEAAVVTEVVRTGVIPPTVNCDHPEFPDMALVPHRAITRPVDVALSNSFGFGGHNAVLAVRAWRES